MLLTPQRTGWPRDRGRASPSVGGAAPERPHLGSGPTRQTKQQKHSSVYCVFTKYIYTGTDNVSVLQIWYSSVYVVVV